ncbi:hypothetical protein WDU94_005062 [Cyamophila willieti]
MSKLNALTVQFFLWYSVEAYYCEFGYCEGDTYCCGENICCNNTNSVYYFWFGVLFVILLLASFCGFFKYCCTAQSLMDRLRSGRGAPYAKMGKPINRSSQGPGLDPEIGPPPIYSEATSLRN